MWSRPLSAAVGAILAIGMIAIAPPVQAAGTAGSRIDLGAGDGQCAPRVVADGDGLLLASFTEGAQDTTGITVRRWTSGSGWGAAQPVAGPSLGSCIQLGLASDGSTAIVMAFAGGSDGSAAIWAAVRPSASAGFDASTAVLTVTKEQAADRTYEFPYFVQAPVVVDGAALIAWSTLVYPEDIGTQLWSSQWQSGGWTAPKLVVDAGAGEHVVLVSLVATDRGALALGASSNGGDSYFGMGWSPTSGWTDQEAVGSPGVACLAIPTALATSTRAVLFGQCGPNSTSRVWAREWSGSAWLPWSAVGPVHDAAEFDRFVVAGDGDVVAVGYSGRSGSGYWFDVARSVGPQAWERPVRMGTSRDEVMSMMLAVAGRDVVAVWDRQDGKDRPGFAPYPRHTIGRVLRTGRTLTPARALGSGLGWARSSAGSSAGAVLAWSALDLIDRDVNALRTVTWTPGAGWSRVVVAGPTSQGSVTAAVAGREASVAWQTKDRNLAWTAPLA